MTQSDDYDVVIIGGGLAGLSLSIQLKQRRPATRVIVIEKQTHPVPEAAHKVGESSVEVGAYYFSKVLGLEAHLQAQQLPKLGLRFFFSADGNRDIATRPEFGTNTFFPARSFQLDRGRLENHLGEVALGLGVEFRHTAAIREAQIGSGGAAHTLVIGGSGSDSSGGGSSGGEGDRTITSRWMVDASGRSSFLKRRLGLQKKVGHDANAVWFRFSNKIAIDDWTQSDRWQRRNGERSRWLSTNHLMGPGYWVWLIPLGSGSTSVGIVVDAKMHPMASLNSFDKALAWLDQHEPQCAAVMRAQRDPPQDFRMLKDYSYSCQTAFSGDRWCLVGEAGAFLDPFYSPGSDYIAMGNTLTCDLVEKDLAGTDISDTTKYYNGIYFLLFDSNLTLFENQYPIYGNAQVMSFKIIWDWAYYWSITATLFFHDRLCDLDMFLKIRRGLKRAGRLNSDMQQLLRRWHESGNDQVPAGFVDVARIPFMAELNRGLTDRLDAAQFEQRFAENVIGLKRLAGEIAGHISRNRPGMEVGAFTEMATTQLELLAPLQAMLFPRAEVASG